MGTRTLVSILAENKVVTSAPAIIGQLSVPFRPRSQYLITRCGSVFAGGDKDKGKKGDQKEKEKPQQKCECNIEDDGDKKEKLPCKSDEELATERTLGVYIRCKPYRRPYTIDCPPEDICELDNIPRMDKLHYKPSKSLNREFQILWAEFEKTRVPPPSCELVPPPIPRRKPKKIANQGRESTKGSCKTLEPMPCPQAAIPPNKMLCPKITLPNCKTVAAKTRCRIVRGPKIPCNRKMTQYPSFSECKHEKLEKPPYVECNCLSSSSMCEMWRNYIRLTNRKQKAPAEPEQPEC